MKLKTFIAVAALVSVSLSGAAWLALTPGSQETGTPMPSAEERDIRPETGKPAIFGTARLPGNRTIGIYGIGPRIVTNYDVTPEEVETLERVRQGEDVPGYSLSLQEAIGPVEMLRSTTPLKPREGQ
jgi:hypothetical protein